MTDRPHVFSMPASARQPWWAVVVQATRDAAKGMEGTGEAPGQNNSGPDVDGMRLIAGVGTVGGGGSWCAVGCSAAAVIGVTAVPMMVPFELHAGASKLARNAGEAGHFVIEPQRWSMFCRYKGALDEEALRRAIFIAWRRGGPDPSDRWKAHVEIPTGEYDAGTDTLWTWAPNVVPKGAARADLIARGFVLHKGQALWHRREHRNGAWRPRLLAVAGAGPRP